MAALTEQQLATLADELGEVDEPDMQDRYDRLGTLDAVAVSVVRARLAALLAGPATFSIPGVVSIGQAENIKAMQAQLQRLATVGLEGTAGGASSGVVTVARAKARPRR